MFGNRPSVFTWPDVVTTYAGPLKVKQNQNKNKNPCGKEDVFKSLNFVISPHPLRISKYFQA